MDAFLVRYAERLYFRPRILDRIVSLLLLPLALPYGALAAVRRRILAHRRVASPVPVVGIGNLIVGGTGKTPMTIALASPHRGVAVVSRGYGRKSRGTVLVSRPGEILAGVEEAGDEAMVMARRLPEAYVIVSEDRLAGIEQALREGAKAVFLDDAFSHPEIEKLELLLEPARIPNPLPLPAGPFREFPSASRYADRILREGRDFRRIVRGENLRDRMVLVTSIARPERLDPHLPGGVVARYHYPDHAWLDSEHLRGLLRKHGADSLLMTEKDAVKLEGFKLPISLLRLELALDPAVRETVDTYLRNAYANENRNGPHAP
ncbi:tetraacyldisaccharide 4'-kinase [Nitratifractor sp.]